MNEMVTTDIFDRDKKISPDGLHRATAKALQESHFAVFDRLPNLVAKIIENKTWRLYGHKSFADYALDHTSEGLGVTTNTRLWIMRSAMDVHGAHIKEWADVLAKVEQMVKLIPVSERGSIANANGNSLETLAKSCTNSYNNRITYVPSRAVGSHDGHLFRLRKNKPDVFKKVVAGEITMVEARKAAGIKTGNESNLSRAQSAFRMMTKKERQEFVAWMREEGFL